MIAFCLCQMHNQAELVVARPSQGIGRKKNTKKAKAGYCAVCIVLARRKNYSENDTGSKRDNSI